MFLKDLQVERLADLANNVTTQVSKCPQCGITLDFGNGCYNCGFFKEGTGGLAGFGSNEYTSKRWRTTDGVNYYPVEE